MLCIELTVVSDVRVQLPDALDVFRLMWMYLLTGIALLACVLFELSRMVEYNHGGVSRIDG